MQICLGGRRALSPMCVLLLLVAGHPGTAHAQEAPPAACTTFSDDPLLAGTPIKAMHIMQLRTCVDAWRVKAGLPAFAWTDPTLMPAATEVKAVHLAQLRNALADVYAAYARPLPAYSDAVLMPGVTVIKRAHVDELRRSARVGMPVISGPCEFTVSPQTMTVSAEKGTYSLQVRAARGCDWSFHVETDDFIEEGGRLADGVTFSIQNNTHAAPRIGRMSVAGHSVTITQRGVADSTACSYAVSPGGMNVQPVSGFGQITVTSRSGCAWTAFSPDAFVHITRGSSGNGTGVVAFVFDDNTTPDARTSVLDVAGHYVTLTQAAVGAGECRYSIAPTLPLEGGDSSETVSVSAPIGCPWSAISEADFLEISGDATGNGSGTFTVRATANPDHQERSATLQVAGQEMTLFQLGSAGEPFCVLAVTPVSVTLPAIGGQGRVVVDASSGCQWSASSGEAWLNLVRTNAGSVTYEVGPNAGDERAILVTIGLFELSINQEGATPTDVSADIVWPAPRGDKVDECFGNCGKGCGTFAAVCGGGHWTEETLNEPQFLGNSLREVCTGDQRQVGVFPQYAAIIKWTYHGVLSPACAVHDSSCRNQLNPLNRIPLLKDAWCVLAAGPVAPVICHLAIPHTWSYSELEVGTTLFPTAIIPTPDAPACGEP